MDHPLVVAGASPRESGARVTTHNGVAVDLRIVAPDAYGNLLQHFSGSAEHNVELRERAVKMGLSVSEHGITDTESGEVARYATEAEVYAPARARLHRAGAAGGQRGDRRRPLRERCRSW